MTPLWIGGICQLCHGLSDLTGNGKSIICQEDVYFKELVRYIHLNPVRAKMVPDLGGLNQYPYCGHSALMNKQKRAWQETDYVLSVFSNSPVAARRSYAAYVKAGYGQGRRPRS